MDVEDLDAEDTVASSTQTLVPSSPASSLSLQVEDSTEMAALSVVEDAFVSEVPVASTERTSVEYTHKHQPVYFLSYLHTITQAWPKLGTVADAHCEAALMACAGNVLSWAEVVMLTEVWSVRRAAVQLVGVLAAAGHLPAEQTPRVLGVIEAGIQEQKYAKVRVEALRGLALVLLSPLRACVDEDAELKSRVREVVRSASTDSQPTILEAVAKVQNIWLK
jgi:hypothetical protein